MSARCGVRWSRGLGASLALAWLALTAACASAVAPAADWEGRLRGNTIALLGEVHDNAEGHRRRLETLQRAIARGWRPAIAMEQFDIDRQADIDRARRERPRDADHLISAAGGSGWDWTLYRPLLQLALDHDLPLIAVNLPRSAAARLVREPAEAVLGAERAKALGLDIDLDPAWQQAQQREIDAGHCGALPPALLPGMVRSQAGRDAVMAERLAQQPPQSGVVLIAGTGHVRRDLGVPRWLERAQGVDPARIVAVGYLEATAGVGQAFDAGIAIAPRADRPDPCAGLRNRAPARQP